MTGLENEKVGKYMEVCNQNKWWGPQKKLKGLLSPFIPIKSNLYPFNPVYIACVAFIQKFIDIYFILSIIFQQSIDFLLCSKREHKVDWKDLV